MSINTILDESYLILRNVNMASYDGNQSLYVGMDLNNTKKQVSEERNFCNAEISKAKTCASSVKTENECNTCESKFKKTACLGKIEWVDDEHRCTFVEAPKHCPPNCYTTTPSPAGPKRTIDKTKCSVWASSDDTYNCCMTTDDKQQWKCSGTVPDRSKYSPYLCPNNDTWVVCR